MLEVYLSESYILKLTAAKTEYESSEITVDDMKMD